ncbi:helix-turn-helix domain-containing protein [uncultured Chryseobacterium sp.]|uniref:helix-turn-helix domain-containing protein n=1 Tax=uncultured Chryseobacterium sp. TaxID=259322 RepID=UPI0025E07069|nr:helix-turn-helix domain-containing protein [uncultured Chryseobacterium sp.]
MAVMISILVTLVCDFLLAKEHTPESRSPVVTIRMSLNFLSFNILLKTASFTIRVFIIFALIIVLAFCNSKVLLQNKYITLCDIFYNIMTKSNKNRDTNLIINKIKFYLGIETDTQFAEYLGTTQSNIATWRKRNTINYDLIIAKCPNIDANWLITSKGEMLKKVFFKENSNNVNLTKSQILDEMMDYLGIENDSQLSKSLKISEETIFSWRNSNTLDHDLIISKYPFFSIDWLRYGTGEKLRKDQYATKEDLQEIYSLVEKMAIKQEAFYELMIIIHEHDDDNLEETGAVHKFKDLLDSIN